MASELEAIYQRARTGDSTARDELIERCLEYVPKLVGAFVTKHGDPQRIYDQLESAGYESLVEVVDQLISGDRDIAGLPALLKRSIQNGIYDQAASWSSSGESKDTVRNQREKCEAIKERIEAINEELRSCCNLDHESKLIAERDLLECGQRFGTKLVHKGLVHEEPLEGHQLTPVDEQRPSTNQFALIELREVIDSCCRNERELAVIDLRSQGMTDCAVAEKLGISQQHVSRIRHTIETRFDAKMKAIDGIETRPSGTISPLSQSQMTTGGTNANSALAL